MSMPKMHADVAVPTSIVVEYDHVNDILTITVEWTWNNPSNKAITAAVFADLNGPGVEDSCIDRFI